MEQIARARARRKRDGKDSIFYVNNKPVDERKINRLLERKNISEDKLLSITGPLDGMHAFVVIIKA